MKGITAVAVAMFLAGCNVRADKEPTVELSKVLFWESAGSGISRGENQEVICYSNSHGLQCKWKSP